MTKPKPQKEETRWCIELPNGNLNLYKTYHLRKSCIIRVQIDNNEWGWEEFKKQGYKCVKIKIRRA